MREIRTLRLMRRGLETWQGRDIVTLADERASKRGTQTSTYSGAPVLDPTKWIKQHLRIKKFLGTSENAVKTQIWCAIATYVLIAIVKKELQLEASLYTLLQILSVSVFEKNELASALQLSSALPETPLGANQLNLFNF